MGFFITKVKFSALVLILATLLGTASLVSASPFVAVDFQTYGARNLTRNETAYSQSIEAAVGDEIEFMITVKNTSSSLARDVFLSVYLPSSLPLNTNSVSIDGAKVTNNIADKISLGNIGSGAKKDVLFKTKANSRLDDYEWIQSSISGSNFGIATRYLSISNTSESENSNSAAPTPTPSPTLQNEFLTISQLGKNLTKKDSAWLKTVQAEPGDTLQFSIMLTGNNAGTVRNVYVEEKLDTLLNSVYGTVTTDGAAASDKLIDGKLYIGDISGNQAKFVKFQVKVAPADKITRDIILSNSARATADNASAVTSIASVNVKFLPTPTPKKIVPTPSPTTTATPKIEIGTVDVLKIGKNITQEQKIATEQILAAPGDELEFTIQITSTGDHGIKNIKIRDILPEEMDYIFNSARMDEKLISDDIVRDSGFVLDSLNPKQTKIVTYRVRVLPEKEFEKRETQLKNLVEISGEDVAKAAGSVQITVKTKNINLLGGVIAFGDLGLLVLIILVILVLLLGTFLYQERRKKSQRQN